MRRDGYLKIKEVHAVLRDEGTEHEYAWVEILTAEGPMIRPLKKGENEKVVAEQLKKRGYTDDDCFLI